MMLSTKEVMQRTGASFRQLDMWCRHEIIETANNNLPGSGNRRKFEDNIVPRIRLMVEAWEAFNKFVSNKALKLIYENYEQGFVDISENITISWKVEGE